MRRDRYTRVAVALHWLIAALLIGNLAAGLFVLGPLGSGDADDRRLAATLVALHEAVGFAVLGLTLFRLGWRLANPPPPLADHLTPFERSLARLSHVGFYVVVLALPLTGWAMVSMGPTGAPVLFGIPVSTLPLPREWGRVLYTAHGWLGWLTAAMIVLHVAAALKHHWFDRDGTLARMLPWLVRRC